MIIPLHLFHLLNLKYQRYTEIKGAISLSNTCEARKGRSKDTNFQRESVCHRNKSQRVQNCQTRTKSTPKVGGEDGHIAQVARYQSFPQVSTFKHWQYAHKLTVCFTLSNKIKLHRRSNIFSKKFIQCQEHLIL